MVEATTRFKAQNYEKGLEQQSPVNITSKSLDLNCLVELDDVMQEYEAQRKRPQYSSPTVEAHHSGQIRTCLGNGLNHGTIMGQRNREDQIDLSRGHEVMNREDKALNIAEGAINGERDADVLLLTEWGSMRSRASEGADSLCGDTRDIEIDQEEWRNEKILDTREEMVAQQI
ncbi:hypothetical protein Scep_012275 [Stephania cephalantha]|uniref:Uncharacterized protein n=1 Tax=Stephania cephalantha TaxID=152367 RepID=A0AAP0JFA0_9MAGN